MSSVLFNSTDFASCFPYFVEAKSFREKEAFKEIEELVFLSYYKDFKLLLCSSCFCSIFPSLTAFKSYLLQDLKLVPLIEQKSIIERALVLFKSLEVSSYKESLELLNLFSSSFILPAFKELKLINLFICNLPSCSKILSSKTTIRKHCNKEHREAIVDPLYKVIKGHGLEANKFFFEIKSESLNRLNRSRRVSSSSLIEPSSSRIESSLSNISTKEAFLANISKKQQSYKEELSNFSLSSKDTLTPFQKRSRYPEYISLKTNKVLVELVAPVAKEELVLEVLVLNLKELLYLSLEKSTFLNKVYLNILNSFEDNKIRNKPFSPLLRSESRIKYFNFFSMFLVFFYRALSKSLKDKTSFFRVLPYTLATFTSLRDLVTRKLEEEGEYFLELGNKSLKKKTREFNKKVNLVKLTTLISRREYEDSSSTSSKDNSLRSSVKSRDLDSFPSSSLLSSSSFTTTSSTSSRNLSSLLDSSNKDNLKEIKKINDSKDTFSLKVKDLLLELIISLLKQTTDLNIFDSPINCFFASISIRASNLSLRNELELSQDYSKFIYSY